MQVRSSIRRRMDAPGKTHTHRKRDALIRGDSGNCGLRGSVDRFIGAVSCRRTVPIRSFPPQHDFAIIARL